MLHQPLVVEERHRRIFYIPEYMYIWVGLGWIGLWLNENRQFQRHGPLVILESESKPGDKDDLAGVKKVFGEQLKGKVGLD